MNNLNKFQNNDVVVDGENSYLSFNVGESNYAINTKQVVEITKLPSLDYPQKLPNNIVGLLNYNNLTINILDIRFYLDINVTPYSISHQILMVKTDEAMFGLLINKVNDIFTMDQSKIENLPFSDEKKLIDFLYQQENDTVSVFNLYALEDLLKRGIPSTDIDIPSLFPQDDISRQKLMQRNQVLIEKSKSSLVKPIFSQDKFISFSLSANNYGIKLKYVKEFLKNSIVTKIPCTPDYIAGLITLRGDFVTVIDLKRFLNLPSNNFCDKNRIILIETSDYQIGLLVDEIFSIIDIQEELITQNSSNQVNKYTLSEVVLDEKLYTILNMKNILSDERFFIEENV